MSQPPDYPDFLTHYYERERGPFRSLSALDPAEAERLLDTIRRQGESFASQRAPDYLTIRRELEQTIRSRFAAKGGQPRRPTPHYLILGACPWVQSWYRDGCELRVPLAAFDPGVISFTVGDSFPAMRYGDGKPYRGQVFTLAELPDVIRRYGLPQVWNPDGSAGPDRYIEAQVWDDDALQSLGWLQPR